MRRIDKSQTVQQFVTNTDHTLFLDMRQLQSEEPTCMQRLNEMVSMISKTVQFLRKTALSFVAIMVLASVFFTSLPVTAAEINATSAQIEFFESKVRPILVDHCYTCHSQKSEKLKGGLLLDTRESTLKGGDTGPAVVPGDLDKSLLIQAVRYLKEDMQMPPKKQGKLSDSQIADLETWVKMGAPDPRTGTNLASNKQDTSKKHWAFQPLTGPVVPKPANSQWVANPIDAFILAKLDQNRLKPSPKADQRTLLRRISLDLTGLPPTPAEMDRFLTDSSSDAYSHVIDRLLASPQYGERWARHWLDIARYADTKGYVFEEERRYPYAYTYRDYVVRSFNNDLPIDRFFIEQLAADLLPLGDDKRPLAALGFLTLGRRFLNNQPDIIDDRIDVTTRGLMGITAVCARCHDHKYDPISIKDYYSLYGVFSSTHEPSEKPLLGTASLPLEYPEYVKANAAAEKAFDDHVRTKELESLSQHRERTGDYLLAAVDSTRLADKGKTEELAKERKLGPMLVRRWVDALPKLSVADHPIFGPWQALSALSETDFASKAQATLEQALGKKEVNPVVAASLRVGTNTLGALKDFARRYNDLFKTLNKAWVETYKEARPTKDKFDEAPREVLRQFLYADTSPFAISAGEIQQLFPTPDIQKKRALRRKVEEIDATHPGSPPRAMAMADNKNPDNPHVFVRGSPHNLGPEVPRQMLEVIAGPDRKPFTKGSGRLEMAESIVHPQNPLTARVFVNRIWLAHFGSTFVRTPSDFGLRSDPPSHPELLDYLAARFMEEGWSLKKLHKLILLSNTYQQSSDDNAAYSQIDPNNNLFWHMGRRRLEFEALRDSLIAVTGKLDLKSGGQPVELINKTDVDRRTIYGFIDRQNLPGLLRTFDFASPDTTSPQRFQTTVPQQALFMINSPFVVAKARDLLTRPDVAGVERPKEKVKALYRVAFQREPESDEIGLALKYINTQGKIPAKEQSPFAWQYGYGTFDTNLNRLTSFTHLPHFTGESWQGGSKVPDKTLGYVLLNKDGGHAGNDLSHVTIRRWIAPRDCLVNIRSSLKHDSEAGDGVTGLVLLRGEKIIKREVVKHDKREIKMEQVLVKSGETLDFVVLCGADNNSDGFTWNPVISTQVDPKDLSATTEWNNREDFSGPKESHKPLNAWEKYAQTLLMSNELVFID